MKDVSGDHQMPHRSQDLTDHKLTEEQEAGILASLAELDAGAGITLADAIETIKRGLGRS
jgi:hypothetical protein